MKPKSLFRRVLEFAVTELERRASRSEALESPESPRSSPPLPAPAPAEVAPPVQASALEPEQDVVVEAHGRSLVGPLEVVRGARGALQVRWAVAQAELECFSGLAEEGAVLCLRVVEFSPARDHVVRDVQDRPAVALTGECDIGRVEGRAVVALGLRAGGRFVSIAHHVV